MIVLLIMIELVCIWLIGAVAEQSGLMGMGEFFLLTLIGVCLYRNYREEKPWTKTDS